MTDVQKHNKELIERYPFVAFKEYDFDTDSYHIAADEDYTSTWLDCMPRGWKKAFGEDLCRELKEALDEFQFTDKYVISQVKEKYGGLRWYDNGIPKGCRAWDVIGKYERISERTCCNCGKPATKISRGWICPWCDDCIVPGALYDDDIEETNG